MGHWGTHPVRAAQGASATHSLTHSFHRGPFTYIHLLLTYLLTHSLTQSLHCAPIYSHSSLVHSLTYLCPCSHSLTHSLHRGPFTHIFIPCSFTHTHSLTPLRAHLLIHPLAHSLTYLCPCSHSLTHSLTCAQVKEQSGVGYLTIDTDSAGKVSVLAHASSPATAG